MQWVQIFMKLIRILLTVIFGVIYIPLNWGLMKLQAWHFPMYKKDKITFFAFAPFYWIYFGIVAIVSIPYEMLTGGAAEHIH